MNRRPIKTDLGLISVEINDIFYSSEVDRCKSGSIADISRFRNVLSKSEQIHSYGEIKNENDISLVNERELEISSQNKDISQLIRFLEFLIYKNKKSPKYSSSFNLILESEWEIKGFVITDDREIKFLVFTKSLDVQKNIIENQFSLTDILVGIFHKKVTVWIANSEQELDMVLRNGNDFCV